MNEQTVREHYEQCEKMVRLWSKPMLLEALYTTHCMDEGQDTFDMRLAILRRLDALTGWVGKR